MTGIRSMLRSARPLVIACLGLLYAAMAPAEVRLPNGEYTETTEDLKVKVLGGFVTVARSWTNGRWYINPAWADLRLTLDSLDGSVKAIDRAGSIYEKAGNGVFVFDERFFIKPVTDGFRWYDPQGNWITYDAAGHMTAYGDRNDVQVRFLLDSGGRRTQVVDHFGNPVLSFQYNGTQLESVTDRTGRKVSYAYTDGRLTQVTDVLGYPWTYTYDGNGQITTRTDPEGRTTTIAYAQSTPAAESVGMRGFLASNPTMSAGIIAKSGGAMSSVASTGSTPRDYRIARVGSVTDAEGGVTSYSYEYDRAALRYKVTQRFPGGRQLISTYDRDGFLQKQQTGSGRTPYSARRDGDRVDVLTDERGLVTRIEYDGARRPLITTFPDGTRSSNTYDGVFGNPLTRTDEAGSRTTYSYDTRGNLLRMVEASGLAEERVSEYTYDQYGQLATSTRRGGTGTADSTTVQTYDTYGNMLRRSGPVGDVSTFTYDVMGNVTLYKDARGNDWTVRYNARGWVVGRMDPMMNAETYIYDRVGNRTTATDASNYSTSMTFNRVNQLVAAADQLGNVTRYKRDQEGRVIEVTDPEGVTTTYAFDDDGRGVRMIDGNGNVTETVYGTAGDGIEGLVAAIVYPTYTVINGYDQRGRLTRQVSVVDSSTKYIILRAYSVTGLVTSETDARGFTTIQSYDALNRIQKHIDALGGVTSYRYDTLDNPVEVTDAHGSRTVYAYDRASRRTQELRPLGQATRYQYDSMGNLIVRTNAKGEEKHYSYDASNRRIEERQFAETGGIANAFPARTVRFTYDPRGLLLSYDDGTSDATYWYNAAGRKVAETVNFGAFSKTISYTYRRNGRKSSFTYPDGAVVDYEYDRNDQLTKIRTNGGEIRFASYRWMVPTSVLLPGASETVAYDALLRPIEINVQTIGNGGPTSPDSQSLMSVKYRYDERGNPVTRSTLEGDFTYSYDALSRLTAAVPPSGLLASPLLPDGLPVEQYAYDEVGNRLFSASQPGAWIYNGNHQLLQYGQDGGKIAFQYDANGREIGRAENSGTRKSVYDASERLVEVQKDGAILAAYYYDPHGRRLRKTVNGVVTYFQYADEGLIGEFDSGGNLTRSFGWKPDSVWMTQPQFKREGIEFMFYHSDPLGTPQRGTSATGALTLSSEYEAFGRRHTIVDAVHDPLRFPGHYYDAETATHHNFFRDYDPDIARYRSVDPVGLLGGMNVYLYTNSPLVETDPFGLMGRAPGAGKPGPYPRPPPPTTGCGKGRGQGVPDDPFFMKFKGCCVDHDNCYDDCAKQAGKKDCDSIFCDCLQSQCQYEVNRGACSFLADAYCQAASQFGVVTRQCKSCVPPYSVPLGDEMTPPKYK